MVIPRIAVGNFVLRIRVGLFPAFGETPDNQSEADFIDGVADIINDVQLGGQLGGVAEHIPRKSHVPDRVDGPSNEDEAPEEVEGAADVGIAAAVGQLLGFSEEDLIYDPRPTDGGDDAPAEIAKSTDWVSQLNGEFPDIAGAEHENGVADEAPEHVDAGPRQLQKEVEFRTHQRHGEEPVDVTEFDGRSGSGIGAVEVRAPKIPHVEVIDGGDGGDQGTDQQCGLPFIRDGLALEVKKDRGCEHGQGPDKKGEPDKVTRFNG